jgi:hypothetical protein
MTIYFLANRVKTFIKKRWGGSPKAIIEFEQR